MTKYIRINNADGTPHGVYPVDKIDCIIPTDGIMYINGIRYHFEDKKLVEDICNEFLRICDEDDEKKEDEK